MAQVHKLVLFYIHNPPNYYNNLKDVTIIKKIA